MPLGIKNSQEQARPPQLLHNQKTYVKVLQKEEALRYMFFMFNINKIQIVILCDNLIVKVWYKWYNFII